MAFSQQTTGVPWGTLAGDAGFTLRPVDAKSK
jgi:hypothetical protein